MEHIILVEDEPLISTMVQLNLEREGYAVTHFADAESLLAYAPEHRSEFGIVLLDIMLPGLHGDAAVVKLRELGVDAPVIMLTAKHEVEARVSALNSGADDYLTKPFNVEELLARVHAHLRRYRAGSQPAKES